MAEQNTLGENSASPQTFNFDNLPVRTVEREGEIWFFATDVCKVLEHTNPSQAINRLDDDERAPLIISEGGKNQYGSTGTQEQTVNIISESGLYSLILTSRKRQAKRFKRWVTHEVLPSIRKTGAYALPAAEPQPAIEGKRKAKQLEHPNFTLASEIAAQAAKAVFEGVLLQGEGWLKNQRLLLSMQQASKYRPIVKPVRADAYVATWAEFIKMIDGGVFLSVKDLVDLATVCNTRLAKTMGGD